MRVSIAILVAVLAVTGIIVFSIYKDGQKSEPQVVGNFELDINYGENVSVDSDGDGLLDWEESLWRTDPLNADTDGDGTNDGDEVDAGRNPTKAGPDDALQDLEQKIIAELESKTVDEDTLTNQLTTDFVTKYFLLRQGGDLSQEAKLALINDFLSSASSLITLGTPYSVQNASTFEVKDNNDLLGYAEEFLGVHIEISEKVDSAINRNASDEELMDEIIFLSSIVASMDTPEEIVELSIGLANAYYNLIQVLNGLSKDREDPVLAIISISLLEDVANQIESNTEDIVNYFKDSGIIYDGERLEIESQ